MSFTVVIAFMALLAALSVYRIAGLDGEIELIVKDRYPKTNIANSIKAQINEISRSISCVWSCNRPRSDQG